MVPLTVHGVHVLGAENFCVEGAARADWLSCAYWTLTGDGVMAVLTNVDIEVLVRYSAELPLRLRPATLPLTSVAYGEGAERTPTHGIET